MQENPLKAIWREGRTVVNGWCGIPSSWSAELLAHAGYDSVTVDMQHGLIHYDAAVPMVQAISTTAAVPLARVPWNEPGIMMKMLDAGCFGIICPMVNTREECERFVGACRYANVGGYRSFGPVRASVSGGPDYFARANEIVLTFAMIETAQAIRNLADIVSTPGLNAVYVGPSDLSLSIDGKPQGDYKDRPDLLDVLRGVVDECDQRGVATGIHCSSVDHAQRMAALGFDFVTLLSDGAYLAAAVTADVMVMRSGEAGGSTGAKESSKGPY